MSLNYKHIAIICAGTLLEVYDSYIFAFLMPEITHHFLPFGSNQQIFSVIAFSTLFIVRPISGILWGILGDNSGKSWVFRNAMLFMAMVTLLIGLLPTYTQIGMVAPLLLLGLRIAQGISISGELSSAIVLCFEQSTSKNRYKNHGTLYAFIFSGIVLANLMVLIVNKIDHHSFSSVWRLPFICGGIFGVLVYFLRRRIQFPECLHKVSIYKLFANYSKPIVFSILANCFVNLSWFYFSSTNTILKENQINSPSTPLICSMIAVVSCYLSGKFLSKWSKARQISLIIFASLAIHMIIFILLFTTHTAEYILIFYYGEAVISGLVFTTIPLLIISELPESYRNSIYTISVNTSTALIVGGLPLILNSILHYKYVNLYLLLMGLIVITLSFIGKMKLQKTGMEKYDYSSTPIK